MQIKEIQFLDEVKDVNVSSERMQRMTFNPMFSDFELHILGVPDNEKLGFSDAGSVDSIYAFRTPTMRNLTFTAPYYHNGTSNSIEEAVEFYLTLQEYIHDNNIHKSGVGINPNIPSLSPLLFYIEDIYSISAFLRSLDDDSFDKTIPESVPSGLPVGGNIQ